MLNTTLRFFDVTPQGRIINRLVKDAESIDFVFGRFLVISMARGTGIIGSIIVSCITSWPCIFIMLITLIVFAFLFSRFRAITPQLKRLESNTRSTVFSICQETLDQLISIRAYNVQNEFRTKFRQLAITNINTQWYSFGIPRWVAFRLQCLATVMQFLIAVIATIMSAISPAMAQYAPIIVINGYSICNIIVGFVEQFTNAESEMPSVERLVEYSNLKPELAENEEVQKKNDAKPVEGNKGLQITNLVMRYRPELPTALKGVTVHIGPHEHVAVVGRTGSGKSSLAITLFKLYQPEGSFNIQVNDEQLSHMPLYDARRKLAIIP